MTPNVSSVTIDGRASVQISMELPGASGMSDLDLSVDSDHLALIVASDASNPIMLPWAQCVDAEQAIAKFNKKRRTLTVTVPLAASAGSAMPDGNAMVSAPGDTSAEAMRRAIERLDMSSPWALEGALPVDRKLGDDDQMAQMAKIPLTVRAIAEGDELMLCEFGRRGLSDESRKTFAPYTFDSDGLTAEYTASIANSIRRRDLHVLATDFDPSCLDGERVVAHAFLWAVSDEIPELGLAVADAWQGRGIGRAMLSLLERAARVLGKPAIELTTMQGNQRARAAYLAAGYKDLGLIRTSLGCDATAAFEGKATPTGFAVEHHMALLLDEAASDRVLATLAAKRARAAELCAAGAGRDGREKATND